MPTADDILEELRNHRRDLHTLLASTQDANDADAARKHEDDAKRHDESAARHRAAARKAREEEDDDDASSHETAAKSAQVEATQCRALARAAYETSATTLAASDETAAQHAAAEAKRLQDEEVAAAQRYADDAEDAQRHEESAAAKHTGIASNAMPFLAMFLKAATDDGANMDAMKDAGNLALLQSMIHAMTYPAGGPRMGKRTSTAAIHDDQAEDTALIQRLIRQYKDGEDVSASRSVADRHVARKLRSIEAVMGEMGKLLTDVVHTMHNLATDTPRDPRRDLSTDRHRQQNGGPVRRTMSATEDRWIGKFDTKDQGEQDMADIDATLTEQGLDPVARMAAKLELLRAGKVKT